MGKTCGSGRVAGPCSAANLDNAWSASWSHRSRCSAELLALVLTDTAFPTATDPEAVTSHQTPNLAPWWRASVRNTSWSAWRPGCSRVTIVQRMHPSNGLRTADPACTVCPTQPSSTHPSPFFSITASTRTLGRNVGAPRPRGVERGRRAKRRRGQHQQRGGVDVPAVGHRPLDGLARVVGGVLEILGPPGSLRQPRSPATPGSPATRKAGGPSSARVPRLSGHRAM